MPRILFLLLVLPGFLFGQAPSIDDLISQLGADAFKDRELASKALWKRAVEAWPKLATATKHEDPEIALRANEIRKRMARGQFHGLEEELAKQVAAFAKGNSYERVKAFPEIMKADGNLGLFLLEEMVEGKESRSQLVKSASTALRNIIRELILDDELERAETLLAMRSAEQIYESAADHAVLLHLLDRPASKDTSVKAYQLSIAGNTKEAVDLCRGNTRLLDLRTTLLSERGDWKTLAQEAEVTFKTTKIDTLGRRAALHRLAGNPEVRESIDDIITYEKDRKSDWYPVEALLLNDEFETAIDLHLKQDSSAAAQLAYELSDYQAVLDLRERLEKTNTIVETLSRNILGPHEPWARAPVATPEPAAKPKPDVFRDTLRDLLKTDFDKARLYALGDASSWHRAIYQLKPEDLPEGRLDAAHAWTERIGTLDNWGYMSAMRSHHYRKAMRDKDYDRAINTLERHRISLHRTSSAYSTHKTYLTICFDSFSAKALRAAESGDDEKINDLLKHFTPIFGSNFGEDDATLFTEAGHPELVAKVLDRTYKHLQPKLKTFPKCADLHNKFAWNVALSRTNLKEGLAASEHSLAVRPKTPMYLDTKAELLFQMKRDKEAIVLIKQAIEMDPTYEYYQRQLKRFEAGDRDVYPK